MEDYEEYEEEGSSRRPLLVILIIVLVLVLAGGVSAFFWLRNRDGSTDTNVPQIGYSAEAKVFLDEDSLSAAMQEAQQNAMAKNIALRYQNNAYSEDGQTFTCLIVNSERNQYDMYLTLFADEQWTDQLLMTDLVPPGSGFNEITLDRALDPGDHTVYVVFTQVKTDEDGKQSIWNQTAHTMEFHVQ